MWTYEFYQDEKGQEPVKDFLLSLPPKHRGVEGKLRELRAHYGNNLYRILYYCDANGVFVLLHAFQKRTLKIPKREIRIAVERMRADQKKKGG